LRKTLHGKSRSQPSTGEKKISAIAEEGMTRVGAPGAR